MPVPKRPLESLNIWCEYILWANKPWNVWSQTLTTEGGVSVDKIAETTIAYLNAKSAVPKPDQEQAASGTVFLDNATMKQVVDHGVKYWGGPCPDGSQAKACCVIL